MARTFKRLEQQAARKRGNQRSLNWALRLRHLEEAMFELNAYYVAFISETAEGRELTPKETAFLECAEEFRKHVLEVLEATNGR